MAIRCLGDSLTEGDYGIFGKTGIANVKEKGYPYFLQKKTEKKVYNYGKCGYTSTDFLEFYLDGNVEIEQGDTVIIMLGTNGGMSSYEDTQGNKDYEKLVKLICQKTNKDKIFLCTPPHVTENEYYSNCGYKSRVEEAEKVIKAYASKYGYKIIDLANYKEFCEENEKIYQSNDGLHYNEKGYEKMAEFIFANL